MPRATKPSPNTRPQKAQRWPIAAGRVADDVTAALSDIERKATAMGKQAERIDRLAALGVEAVREGNYLLAVQLFQDIRTATALQNHTSAAMLGTAGTARTALAGARVGEYSTD